MVATCAPISAFWLAVYALGLFIAGFAAGRWRR